MNKEQILNELDLMSAQAGPLDLGIMRAVRHFVRGGYYAEARRYAKALTENFRGRALELLP